MSVSVSQNSNVSVAAMLALPAVAAHPPFDEVITVVPAGKEAGELASHCKNNPGRPAATPGGVESHHMGLHRCPPPLARLNLLFNSGSVICQSKLLLAAIDGSARPLQPASRQP